MEALGLMYRNAMFALPADPKRAAYWFQRAAQNGDAMAMYNLANMLASGLGMRKDIAQAKDLLPPLGCRGKPLCQSEAD
jgi:TPR repeat protein